MNIEAFRNYCLRKPGTTEEFPFDHETLVFKVGGKMYALCNVDFFEHVNLKCDPEKAIQLREMHDSVLPGYHMNKKHWNTVVLDGSIPDYLIFAWTDHSYELVRDNLPARIRKVL
jgi:predicted DNA-binding protein (MmcQ/YjbR family)